MCSDQFRPAKNIFMKSRISIDVDYDNQPIIKIEYQNSEDVRDKLVKKFMETFGSGQSIYATFLYYGQTTADVNTAVIRPVRPDQLSDDLVVMRSLSEDYERNNGKQPPESQNHLDTGQVMEK
jgi:hypothetical protein